MTHDSFLRHPIIACATALAIAATAQAAAVTTETVSFYSTALDTQTTYIAALPTPLRPDHKYPVLYLLHGAYGSHRDWTEQTTFTEELEGRDMIVIMPDGGEFGWYLDSQIDAKNQYDTAVTRDVRLHVESRFPVRTDREGRAIAGLSMGGHGALSLAAKHPELYVSASSMSGILDVSAHPGQWHLDDLLGKQPDALHTWKCHSVLHLADVFTTADVALLFDTGIDDKTGAVADSQHFHQALEKLDVPHEFHEFKGTHNWDYWRTHITEHLDFHQRHFRSTQ